MKTNTPKMKKLFSKKNNKLNLKRVKEDFSGLPPGEDDDEDLNKMDDETSDLDLSLSDDEKQDLDHVDSDDNVDELDDETDMDADEPVDDVPVDGDDVGGGADGKDLLKQMIMAIIDGDEEAASDALHQFMTDMTSSMVNDDEPVDDLGGDEDLPPEDDLGGDDMPSEDDLGGDEDLPPEDDLGGDDDMPMGDDDDELELGVKEGKTWKDSGKKKKVDNKVCPKCKQPTKKCKC